MKILKITSCLLLCIILLNPEKVYSKDDETKKSSPEMLPKIQATKTVYDFGQIYETEKITHIYEFKNVGESVLKVHKAKTFCNCTTPEVLNKEVLPGEIGKVKITLDPSEIKERGSITRSVELWTNDPDTPEVTFKIIGELLQEVDVSPKFLNFGTIKKQEKNSKNLIVSFASTTKLKILKVESSSRNIKANVLPAKEDRKAIIYEIQIVIDKNASVGRLAEYVTIYTNSKANPIIKKLIVADLVDENNTISNIKKRIKSLF